LLLISLQAKNRDRAGSISEQTARVIAETTAAQLKEVMSTQMKGMTSRLTAGGGGDDISVLLQACARGDLRAVQQYEGLGGDLRAVDYDKR
jgi:hypothetical protein